MKCLAICITGFEDICSNEIFEILKKKSKQLDSCVEFEANEKEYQKFCYYTQTSSRVLRDVNIFDINNIKSYKLGKTFAVRCIKKSSNLNSLEVESKVGEIITGKVNLDDPDVTVIVFLNDKVNFIGLDDFGDLSKRSYKIFLSPKSIKGNLAFSLLKFAGYDGKKTILDCFCSDGVIAIEAAAYSSGKSVRYYDKDRLNLDVKDTEVKVNGQVLAFDSILANVEKTKKNAKIAGVEKFFKVSKIDVEWLDTKLDEGSIDIICSQFPEISKRTNKKDIEKLYKEFFYQIDFVLSNKGVVVALLHHPEFLIERAEKFNILEKKEFYSGKDKLYAVKFQRQ